MVEHRVKIRWDQTAITWHGETPAWKIECQSETCVFETAHGRWQAAFNHSFTHASRGLYIQQVVEESGVGELVEAPHLTEEAFDAVAELILSGDSEPTPEYALNRPPGVLAS